MIITKFDPSCVFLVIKNQNRYKHVLRNPMKHTVIPKEQPEKLAREPFACVGPCANQLLTHFFNARSMYCIYRFVTVTIPSK